MQQFIKTQLLIKKISIFRPEPISSLTLGVIKIKCMFKKTTNSTRVLIVTRHGNATANRAILSATRVEDLKVGLERLVPVSSGHFLQL